jgi:hypothetical protein
MQEPEEIGPEKPEPEESGEKYPDRAFDNRSVARRQPDACPRPKKKIPSFFA